MEDEFLNFISHPFYDLRLIVEFLSELFNKGNKILYITHDETYIRSKAKVLGYDLRNLTFSGPLSSFDLNLKFDLVVFDDISGISLIDDNSILTYVSKVVSKKKLIMSMREILECDKIYVLNSDMVRFKEPRSIQTKVDLNYDIPNVIFKFFEWFFDNKSKIILVTKDVNSNENVYGYMKKYVSISLKLKNLFVDSYFKSFSDFQNNVNLNSYIYVTSIKFLKEFHEFISNNYGKLRNFNIVVFFASDKVFSYKNLLSLCGSLNFLRECKNEVIFVSNYENIEILMAKRISRSYNERIWEFGLRKY